MRVFKGIDGYPIANERIEVIIEYLKSNGAIEPINISSIMLADKHDPETKTSEHVYAIEYTSSNTNELHNIYISIRDRKINKLIE